MKFPIFQKSSFRSIFVRPWLSYIILLAFVANTLGILPAYAQSASSVDEDFRLPAPGVMVHLSPPLEPPILKGIKVHPNNPFQFDFILDKGDKELNNDQIKDESVKLIKYFLASLTIPEKDLWVNLSPYEKERIIPQSFGLTEMGRDLLAEDYMLKQITASLIYPEDGIGKKFWKRIYEEAAKKYGTTNIPVNTFNKVWIIPQKAVVYENAKAGTAYVVESKLKVMLEQDYLSLAKHQGQPGDMALAVSPSRLPSNEALNVKAPQGNNLTPNEDTSTLGSQIVREIVIPELTKEVNENKNFVRLRQVYNSLILATWYKKKITDSILSQVYTDKNKVAGVNIDDPKEKEKIYQRYLQAFKKGVYNYIKEDLDPTTQEVIPRKYFSGGVQLEFNFEKGSQFSTINDRGAVDSISPDRDVVVKAGVEDERQLKFDFAMQTKKAKGVEERLVTTVDIFTYDELGFKYFGERDNPRTLAKSIKYNDPEATSIAKEVLGSIIAKVKGLFPGLSQITELDNIDVRASKDLRTESVMLPGIGNEGSPLI